MATLHILNVSHDYALASFSPFYTPPASVARLEEKMRNLPKLWSLPGDLTWGEVADPGIVHEVKPWGWNPMICRLLQEAGIDSALLPPESDLRKIRDLSHRRNTIPLNQFICRNLEGFSPDAIPMEITSVQEGMSLYAARNDCYFKAPWSSSGRGIIKCSDLEPRHIEPWLKGIIRKQGSVMYETLADRTMDFASLWICSGGEARFAGWSVFSTSPRGKYISNLTAPCRDLERIIRQACRPDILQVASCQKEWLDSNVAPHYNGPAGIDMMVLNDGSVRPCVEINIRNTMGHVAAACAEKGISLHKYLP